MHGPLQYELVCLRSVNAESQERLFSQAKHISVRATNRKPENVLPTILLSMQAKQKTGEPLECMKKQESMVSAVGAKVPEYTGTKISKTFISNCYLQHGGVWWKKQRDHYFFSGC